MNLISRRWKQALLMIVLSGYTAYAAGPFIWVSMMSLRTTPEISDNPYAFPTVFHWEKFATAWSQSNYSIYFWNSVMVTSIAVLGVTLIGSMAAHCLARYRFPGNRLVLFTIFSTLIFPPQIVMISLFQVLVGYGLFDTRYGLVLVYIALQLPLTVYILEGFFSRLPQDLFDAAKIDGYSNFEIYWRLTLPIGLPAIATTVILNFIYIWNEFLFAVVLIASDEKRTLPLGIQKFYGDRLEDVGMIATGVMISVIPVILIYIFFSEKMIKGMTAGAVK
jgi:multiple sugar transport system permease protein/raffinose/stachyose/melibiose transport system permease protein